MMSDRRMLKYPLFYVCEAAFDDTVTIQAPRSLGINHVAMQSGSVVPWSLVDIESDTTQRMFKLFGTGQTMEPVGNYLGTVHERAFVWHIFELF